MPYVYVHMKVEVPPNISEALMFMDVDDDENAAYQFALFAVLLTACQMTTDTETRNYIWNMVELKEGKQGIYWKPDVAAAAGGGRSVFLSNAMCIALSLIVVVGSSFVPR